jgi:hypothetical protein
MAGFLAIVLPQLEYMHFSASGKVIGQIYIGPQWARAGASGAALRR